MKMEISEKDKKLLLVLAALLIFCAAYFLGYQKLDEKAQEYKIEYNQLSAREADLMEKEANIETYKADKETMETEYSAILAKYGNGITQTYQIDFLNRLERITDAWVKSVSFANPASIYTFGAISTSNPNGSGLAYTSDLKGFKTSLTLAYEADYAQWKELVKYLNEYYSKNVIESISMSYSEITGLVSGTMTLALYSVIGTETQYVEPEFEVGTGSENIFKSEYVNAGVAADENGDYIFSQYEYYIAVNSATSSLDSCMMGRKGDTAGESIVSDNSNDTIKVDVKFTKSGEKYNLEYKVGDETYKEECTPQEALEILVISTAKLSEEDNVEIKLSVTNTADIPLNVKVYNDGTDGRVKIEKTDGNVVIY